MRGLRKGLSGVAAAVLIAAGCGGGQNGQTPDGTAPAGMETGAAAGMETGADASTGAARNSSWLDAEETIVSGAAQQFQVGFNNTTIAARLPDALLIIWSKEGAPTLTD